MLCFLRFSALFVAKVDLQAWLITCSKADNRRLIELYGFAGYHRAGHGILSLKAVENVKFVTMSYHFTNRLKMECGILFIYCGSFVSKMN